MENKENNDRTPSSKQAAAAKMVVGDGLAEGTTMGPLNNKMQYDRVIELMDDAKANGAKVRKDAKLTFSTTIQPPYKHHTTSIEPTKDKSLCSNKVASETDANFSQFMTVLPQECTGQLASFGPT
jgi:acyl-CoA reductase-like NAD-dependent aldehyde dehydrogenase